LFLSFSQIDIHSDSIGFKGPIKSIFTYDYSSEKSDTVANQKSLSPACGVCDHFQKFDKKGRLIEKQEYVILEPVSDLDMGYCLNMIYEYSDDKLVLITSKKFEEHGMKYWSDDFENGMKETMFSSVKVGEITTTKYVDGWGETYEKKYENGLLIQDNTSIYTYDEKGRKIKSEPIDKDSNKGKTTETWIYKNDLLTKYTSFHSGNYSSGYVILFTHYPSKKLLSKKNYRYSKGDENSESKLTSTKYYYEDGRDSVQHYINLYAKNKKKRHFSFEYQFHPNGTVLTKTQKTEDGEICDYETHDDRGNLTQYNLYNISFEAYKIDKHTYNEKDQLIETFVVDNYDNEEYTMLYKYDQHGNQTHTYFKNDQSFTLVQENVFEYYD
jgi:hypothetical protein